MRPKPNVFQTVFEFERVWRTDEIKPRTGMLRRGTKPQPHAALNHIGIQRPAPITSLINELALRPIVCVIKADDVIFAKIGAHLNLDNFHWAAGQIFQAVDCALGDVDNATGANA